MISSVVVASSALGLLSPVYGANLVYDYYQDHSNIYLYDNNISSGEKPDFNQLILGGNQAAAEYQQIIVYAHPQTDSKLHITDNGASIDMKNVDLTAQSMGFSQQLISGVIGQTTGRFDDGSVEFSVVNDNQQDHSSIFVQSIKNGDANVGTATYLIGGEAINVLRSETELSSFANAFTDNGIQIIDEDVGQDQNDGIYMAAVLAGINVEESQTLKLNIGEAGNTLYTQISGKGGVNFEGVSAEESVVTIDAFSSLAESGNELGGANTYSGDTTLSNVTINLNRENSFGENGKIIATNAVINEVVNGAFDKADGQKYENVDVTLTGSFNVAGDAEFIGNNNIHTNSGSLFNYTVSGTTTVKDGKTIFSPSKGSVHFSTGNLNVFNAEIDADAWLTVNDTLTLTSKIDGVKADTVEVGKKLVFVDISNGVFNTEINGIYNSDLGDYQAISVVLDNSDISYENDWLGNTGKIADTTLQNASSLTFNVDDVDSSRLLGDSVTFVRDEGDGRSELHLVGDGTSLVADVVLHGDGLLRLDGAGADTTAVSFGDKADLTDFNGWVRIENGSYKLDAEEASRFNHPDAVDSAGLSIGSGGVVAVVSDETVEMDKFGWQAGGVLDLSQFDFSKGPALEVGQMSFANTVGEGNTPVIRVDPNEILSTITPSTDGTVFSYDNANLGTLLIQTTIEDDFRQAIAIQDAQGNKGGSLSQTYFSRNGQSLLPPEENVAGVGTWTWTADYYDGDDNLASGIYTTFSLGTLELRNGREDAVQAGETLRWDSAFLAQSSESAQILTSKVTGYGIFEVTSYAGAQDNEQNVYLHNAENDYQGATVVRENTTLGFSGTTDTDNANAYGSLGHSTVVLTGGNANLLFEESTSEGQTVEAVQRITGIHTDDNNHLITLSEGAALEVNGNAAAEFDQDAQAKYGVGQVTLGDLGIVKTDSDQANLLASLLGEKTVFTGSGTLRLEGTASGSGTTNLVLSSADAVNSFNGDIQINDYANLYVAGDEVLNGGIFTTAESEDAGSRNRNITLTVEAHVGEYTVDGVTYLGADFSGYQGRVILDSPDNEVEGDVAHKFIIHGDQAKGSIWWNDSGVLAGDGSILQLDGTKGRFTNSFTRYDPTAMLSTIELVNGTNLVLDDTSGNLSAAGIFDIDGSSSLTLKGSDVLVKLGGTRREKPNLTPGENEVYTDANRFKGEGSLTLSGLTLRDSYNGTYDDTHKVWLAGDEYINVDDFTGTLSLTDETKFTISASRGFNAVIGNDSTLAVESDKGVSLKDDDSWKSLSYSGNATLDLSAVQFKDVDYNSAMLSVDALTEAAEGSTLTINLGSQDPLVSRTKPGILSQDEGWTALIIDAQRKDVTVEAADINITVNGESVAGEDFQTLNLAEGVTAGYQAGAGLDDNGDVGMQYALKTLDLDQGSSLQLEGDANAEPDARGLSVRLYGAGTLGISGDVTIKALGRGEGFEASSFTGTYDLAAESTLRLTGLGDSTAAVEFEDKSTLSVDSNQNLILKGEGKAGNVELNDGVTLTLHTDGNALGAGSTIQGGSSSTISFADDAELHLAGAAAAIGQYSGTIDLGSSGTLHLDDTAKNNASIDQVAGAAGSSIVMTSGSYVRTKIDGYAVAYQVGNAGDGAQASEALLTLKEWGKADSAQSFANPLSGNGTVALQNSFVQIDNALDFTGTWDLASNAGQDRLVVETDAESLPDNGVEIGSKVALGLADELVFRTEKGLPSAPVEIKTAVEGDGSFIVESGRYKVEAGTAVDVAETDVVSGASLTVAGLRQLGDAVTADGTVVVAAGTDVELANKVLKTTADANGARTLQVNAGEGNLTIGEGLEYQDFDGQIRLASGTYPYVDEDADLWTNVGFAAGGNGRFVYSGDEQIQLKAFSWDYRSGSGNGVLDIDEYAGSHEQAAIHAGTLKVNPGAKISIDLNDWIQNLDQTTGVGNVLDLDADEGDGHSVWLVTGDVVTGTDGNLELLNNGEPLGEGSSQTADVYSEPHGKPGSAVPVAATGVWDYGVDVVEKAEGASGEGGVRLSYALREIRMHEGQTLNITTEDSSDKTLTARITDKDPNTESHVVVKTGKDEKIILNPVAYGGNEGNDFHGTLTVAENSNLQTMKSQSLGDETSFTLEKGSSFVMGTGASDENLTERVKLTAEEGSKLTVNGNRLELLDGSNFTAGAVVLTGTETTYGQRSRLVSVEGDVRFSEAADTLKGYAGLLVIDGGASMTFAGGNGESEAFTLADLEGEGTAIAERDVVIGDASAFGGTFEAAAGRTIFVDADSVLSDGTDGVSLASVKLNEKAVLDTSAAGRLTTISDLTTGKEAVLRLGSIAMLGTDAATGAIRIESSADIAEGTTIEAEIDPNRVSAENLLELDGGGKETTLIELGDGVSADLDSLKLDLSTPEGEGSIAETEQTATGILYSGLDDAGNPDGEALGDLTYDYKLVRDENRIAVEMNASTLALYEDAVLDIREAADDTLSLQLIGGKGTVRVGGEGNAQDVIFTGENSFGALNVAEGATLEIRDDQTLAAGGRIDGSIISAEGSAIRLGSSEAELLLTKVQNELKGGIALGGGTLVLDGTTGEFGTGWNDSLLASNVTGEGTVSIQGVTGMLDAQLGSAEDANGVHLIVGGGSAVLLDRDNSAFAQSNISDVVIGEDGDADRSVLVVRTANAGIAQSVDVDIRSNGTLHYALSGQEAGVVTGNIGDLTGSGRFEVDLVDGSAATHEVILNAVTDTTTVAPAFDGTFSLWRGKFVFGADAGEAYDGNNEMASNAGRIEAGYGSLFQLHGEATVNGFNAARQSTVDFSWNDSGLDVSDNLLTIREGGSFDLAAGSTVRVNTDGIAITEAAVQAETHDAFDFASILATRANEAEQTFYQIVEGAVGDITGTTLADAEGTAVGENEFTISLYDGSGEGDPRHVADLYGGLRLVKGEDGSDLYVGQGINGAVLHESVVLSGENVDITDQWLRADESGSAIGFTVSSGSTVSIGNRGNSFTGTALVEEGATLHVAGPGALGGVLEGSGEAALDVRGSAVIDESVAQGVAGLSVADSGSLSLNAGSTLTVRAGDESVVSGKVAAAVDAVLAADSGAHVRITDAADLGGMKGTFRLAEDAQAEFAAGEGAAMRFTTGAIEGGTVRKTGAGSLTLAVSQFAEGDAAAVSHEGGSLAFEGWDDAALRVADFKLGAGADPFVLGGDVEVVGEGGAFRNEGTLRLQAEDAASERFAVRTIKGDYAGSGTIVFNAFLGSADAGSAAEVSYGEHADLLVVTGNATGTANFVVNNLNSEDAGKLERLALMEVGGSAEAFSATLNGSAGGTIEAGGYSYHLEQIDGAEGKLGTGTDFILTSYQDNERVISVNNGAFIGVAAAAQMFDLSIHDRMGTRPYINPLTGEKDVTSMWIRQSVIHERSRDTSGQLTMRNTSAVTQLGGDIVQLTTSGGGYAFAGAMAGWGTEDWKVRSNRSDASSRADIDGWSVGVYGGWHQNDPKNDRTGAYVNGWVQFSAISADVSNNSDERTVRAEGLSASLEAGWNFHALSFKADGGTTQGDLYVEPRAQVTWWGMDYDDLEMNGDVRFLGEDNVTTRLGVRTSLVMNGSTTFVPFLEANWVHNTNAYGASYGEVTDYQAGAENQAELKLGADVEFTKNFVGYGQFTVDIGDDGYNRRQGSIGLKYRW